MADKTDKCVVRNSAYKRGGLNKRERHNERKNADYQNDDIIKERADYNVHFKRCTEIGDDKDSGYAKAFDKMLAAGVISTRGIPKENPNIVDELVFDVNTDYFERGGGYEYAKSFFEEAYRCAVQLIGGEQYVLSAVMHADERNKLLSEQFGRDIYHYHLHVVYIPVVDKEIYFRKDNKDPELAGKLREVIKQVSHSKKWPRLKQLDENGEPVRNAKGKAVLVNAYSLLQDQFFQHMRDAGFLGFERGERGSTAEHLTVVEYKTQQEKKRAAEYTAVVEAKQEAAAALDVTIAGKVQAAAELDEQTAKKKKQLDDLKDKTAVVKQEAATFAEIEAIPKKTLGGNFQLTPADWKKVSGLAKEGVKSRSIIAGLKKRIADFISKVTGLEKKLKHYEGVGISDTMQFYNAKQGAPIRLAATVADIMRNPPEQAQQRPAPQRNKTQGMEM